MSSIEINDPFNRPAKTLSIVFHPLFMPLYALLIIFSAPTLLGYLPFQVKKLLFLLVLVNNVLLPLALLPFFKHWNIITSWNIENRRERNIPLILTTVLYSTTAFIISGFPVPVFLKSFFYALCIVSVILTVINFWWKISLHSAGAGALIAIVLILSFKMYSPLTLYLIISLISGGLILTSRLNLNLHSPGQVWMGFFTGLSGLTLFMLMFQ
jgi:hypothetical protein